MQNNDYETAGAKLVDTAAALGSDIVLKVRPPSVDAEVPLLKSGGHLISYIQPAVNKDLVAQLGERKVNVIGAPPSDWPAAQTEVWQGYGTMGATWK